MNLYIFGQWIISEKKTFWLSLATDMVGTLNYMAPEQVRETDDGSRSVKVGKDFYHILLLQRII